ncbi:MAG: DUF2461 domain-containing protein [Pelobium sp.]
MIKKEIFTFLTDLVANNERDWFQENKQRYEEAKQNVEDFANAVLEEIRKTDKTIPEDLIGKKCVMRIYRDVRFSKNKLPYKNNISFWISSRGKGGDGPGYYVHIQPGKSFIAGGYWMPQADHLKAIRQEIDYNTDDFLKITQSKEFTNYFGSLDDGEKLKNHPKGYEATHPHIELLKLKSFTVTHSLSDKELANSGAVNKVVEGLKIINPFVSFLNQAIL